jgi:hypothetical protein
MDKFKNIHSQQMFHVFKEERLEKKTVSETARKYMTVEVGEL